MRKLFLLCCLFVYAQPVMAGCVIEVCFQSETECPAGTIEDINHICQSCDVPDVIRLGHCRDLKEIQKICPNRLMNGYKSFSFKTKEVCKSGEFLGNDGVCYSCDIDKSIKFADLTFDKFLKICPDRYAEGCGYTVANCPKGSTPVKKGNYCDTNCPDHSIGTSFHTTGCIDDR